MRRLVTFIVPAGGPLSTAAQGPFTPQIGPRNVFAAVRSPLSDAPAVFDFAHMVVSFESGAKSAPVTVSGPSVWLVMEGEITVEHARATSTYAGGKQFLTPSGHAITLSNARNERAVLGGNLLLEPGAALPSLQAAAAAPIRAPSTGDGGLADRSGYGLERALGAILAAAGVALGASKVLRDRRAASGDRG